MPNWKSIQRDGCSAQESNQESGREGESEFVVLPSLLPLRELPGAGFENYYMLAFKMAP
jgi:hypothetical protein